MRAGLSLTVIIAAMAGFFVWRIQAVARERAFAGGRGGGVAPDRGEVRHLLVIRIGAVLGMLLGAFVIAKAPAARQDQRLLAAGVGVAFLVAGALLAWEAVRSRISSDERGLTVVGFLGRKEIPWAAIRSVRFEEDSQLFVVETAGYGELHGDSLFTYGWPALARIIEERLRAAPETAE